MNITHICFIRFFALFVHLLSFYGWWLSKLDSGHWHSSMNPREVDRGPGPLTEGACSWWWRAWRRRRRGNSRRRRREQSPSTYAALFLRRGGAASVLPRRTPTQHMEDGATTPTFFVSGSGRPRRISTP